MSMNKCLENAVYIGLDIGTGSVGWAVTDDRYNLCRSHGKDMWGTRLFDDAKTAQERRGFRVQRRRLQRRNQRLALLQELFADEINKVDPGFFQRMSLGRMIYPKYKDCKYTLFADEDFSDREYHKLFPTIYHLRLALMNGQWTDDVRFVYLALHHILKHRGHFLTADMGDQHVPNLLEILKQCEQSFDDELGMKLHCNDVAELENVMFDTTVRRSAKRKSLLSLFDAAEKQQQEWLKALSGDDASLDIMFDDPALKSEDNIKINFSKPGLEAELPNYEAVLGERMYLLELWRAVYNWAVLKRLLGGYSSLSEAKVNQYEQHAKDLAELKNVIRQYDADIKKRQGDAKTYYAQVFQDEDVKSNYCHLVGFMRGQDGKKSVKRCSHAEFCKFIKSILDLLPQNDTVRALKDKAERQILLPRLISSDNGIIPYQLHRAEMNKILENAAKKLSFLSESDGEGITPAQKIKMLLEFRIPYYVGPLNSHSPNSWAVRLEEGKIYPWNFEKKIDVMASAHKFIDRMTSNCTYLSGCTVIPACSPLYERFKVLNEINPMTLNGEPISVELKQKIYSEVFMRNKKPTIKTLIRMLNANGYEVVQEDIGGIDVEGGIKSNLRTELLIRAALGEKYTPDLAEKIVAALTYLGDDRRLLREKLSSEMQLSYAVVRRISQINCTGWGRLSSELLLSIRTTFEGMEETSIMDALWHSNQTLAGLLSEQYGFHAEIQRWNEERTDQNGQDFIQELYVSPSVKRQIYQTMAVVKELRKIIGHDPKKVFIEMARGGETKPERKLSRKQRLTELYKSIADIDRQLCEELDRFNDQDLRRDKLYLYFTQLGRCMYSNERIELKEVFDKNKYDIDHIYPRSKVKDDSLDNRVLVKAELNRDKTNTYPIGADIRHSQHPFWNMLLRRGLISKMKYDRLTRQTAFTEEELTGFIARQLVETRQGTKAVAELLKRLMPNTDIIYVKAHNVSEFRQLYDMPKVRELNDIHHAKDAYLNIVVGNVYDTKFTRSPANFMRNLNEPYNLRKMYEFPVVRYGVTAWIPGEGGTLTMVRKVMSKNSALVTFMAVIRKGEIADAQPLAKGNGQLPLKKGLPIEDYGGYNSVKGAYFMLVEHRKKKKMARSIIDVPIHLMTKLMNDPGAAREFCEQERNLQDARIVVPVIRVNSLLSLNGFKAYITSRTGYQIHVACAHQLILSPAMESYVKRIMNYCFNANEYEKTHKKGETYHIVDADKITREKNISLYETLMEKLKNRPYSSMPNNQWKALDEGKGEFEKLSLEQQCYTLAQVLQLFSRKNNGADLRFIGGSKQAGIMQPNREISKCKEAYIIYQSPTGLIEKEVDLLR